LQAKQAGFYLQFSGKPQKLCCNLSAYAKSVHEIFHEEYSFEECMAAGKSFIDSLSSLSTELNKSQITK
jgi:hypothetical protein